jgi:hypothetical protein
MVIISMLEQFPKTTIKELLIVDCFSDAKGVSQRLSLVLPQDCMSWYFEDEKSAYSWVFAKKYSKLFIDSDVGFLRWLTLINIAIRSPKTQIAVYEEGLGTYRHELYSGIKKIFLESLGCGVYFGGNLRTKELYVYSPEECDTPVRAKKIKIEKKIDKILVEKKEFFKIIFNANKYLDHIEHFLGDEEECEIYLSDWKLDHARVSGLTRSHKLLLVKPHPNIKTLNKLQFGPNTELIEAGIPAEILMMWASARFKLVRVFHHGSSVTKYSQHKNIRYTKVN